MTVPPNSLKTLLAEEVKPLGTEEFDIENSSREERLKMITKLTKSLDLNTMRVADLDVQIKILSTLARGKLKDRLTTALRYAGPLYKTLCPRRYRDLPGYSNPRHLLIMGVCAGMCIHEYARKMKVELSELSAGDMRKLLERSQEGPNYIDEEMNKRSWRVMGDLIDNEVPTYYLDHETCEAVMATECEGLKISWGDFDWPHSSFMWVPPRDIFPNSPLFIVAHRDDRYVTFTGVTEKEVDHKNNFFIFEVPVQDSIGEGLSTMSKVIEKRVIERGPSEEGSDEALRAFLFNVYTLCANSLLAMVAEPEFEEELRPGQSRPKVDNTEHKPRDPMAVWNPTFFRVAKQSKGDGSHAGRGLGSQRRAHPRRAHWKGFWLEGDATVKLEVGKRARCITDQRLAMWVVSISPDVVILKSASGEEHPYHPSEVKPARLHLRWIKRAIIGLKNHVGA